MNLPEPKIDRDTAMDMWVKEHSEYAKEQLVLNHKGIVGIVLKSMNLNIGDDDLFMTGLVGIVKAINNFDAEKGYTFSAYATQVVKNEILGTFRKRSIETALSLDECCNFGSDDKEILYKDMIADERQFEYEFFSGIQTKEALGCLNEKERVFLCMWLSGRKQSEIAEMNKMSKSYVSKVIKRACKKIERNIN